MRGGANDLGKPAVTRQGGTALSAAFPRGVRPVLYRACCACSTLTKCLDGARRMRSVAAFAGTAIEKNSMPRRGRIPRANFRSPRKPFGRRSTARQWTDCCRE